MARKLVVSVLADVTGFSRNLKEATVVSEQFSSTVTTGTNQAARAVVAASVKTTESLRAQAVAYREIAAAAVVGSEEQIAAARLAEKAELKLAAAMGVTAHEADQLRVHSAGLNRELGQGLRGVASGSGIMHGFGRSLAFASGGFLAFEGASRFLEESVKVAREAAVSQRQLAAQMKASGESFAANKTQIDRAELSLEKYGFTSEDSSKALTVLERGTGNITRAINLQGVAANLARAKNIDLASAANVLAKVFGGQETALRRAVPGLEKNAHGMDLIRLAQARLAGQAAASTTPQERFAATLHDTERIVGTELLPILDKYLTSLSQWLHRMNESGQLQKDVASAVDLVTSALSAAKAVVTPLVEAFKDLNSITGGTKDTVKLLASAFAAFKITNWLRSLGLLSTSIRKVGTEAETSTGKVKGLRLGLGSLPEVVAITLGIDVVMNAHTTEHGLHRYSGSAGWGNLFHDTLHFIAKAGILPAKLFGEQGGDQAGNAFSAAWIEGFKKRLQAAAPAAAQAMTAGLRGITGEIVPAAGTSQPIGLEALKPFDRAQLAISAAQLTKGSGDNLKAYTDERLLLEAKIAVETKRLQNAVGAKAAQHYADNLKTLQGQLASANNEIESITKQAQGRTPAELAGQRNTWFDTMIDRQLGRVQDIKTLQGQNVRLTQIGAELQNQIAKVKDVTRKATLLDKLADVFRTRKANQQQIHQDAIDAKFGWLQLAIDKTDLTKGVDDNIDAEDKYIAAIKGLIKKEGDSLTYEQQLLSARQARRGFVQQAAQDRQTARENRQFAALGLGPGGAELVPTAAALRGRLGRLEDAVTGTFLDTSKTNQLFNRIQRALSGNFGTLTESVRSEIKQMLDTVSQQFDQKPAAKKTRHNLFTALGLTPTGLPVTTIYNRADYETLRRTWTPGMGALRFGHGSGSDFSLGRSVTINGGVHVHGIDNPRQFMNELEKMQRGRPHARRGVG